MNSSRAIYTSNTEEYGTPPKLFEELDKEFHFTLDPCSTDENAKCAKHYTKADNGLEQDWSGERVFCNPPYGKQIKQWMKKCSESNAEVVVALVPARTDTEWFHRYVYGKAELRFVKGRVKFFRGGTEAQCNAPFPSMICVYRMKE